MLHSDNPERHDSPVFDERKTRFAKDVAKLAENPNLKPEDRMKLAAESLRARDEDFINGLAKGYEKQSPTKAPKGMSFGEAKGLISSVMSFDIMGVFMALAEMMPSVMKISDAFGRATSKIFGGEWTKEKSITSLISESWKETNDQYSINGAVKEVKKHVKSAEQVEQLETVLGNADLSKPTGFVIDDKERAKFVATEMSKLAASNSSIAAAFGLTPAPAAAKAPVPAGARGISPEGRSKTDAPGEKASEPPASPSNPVRPRATSPFDVNPNDIPYVNNGPAQPTPKGKPKEISMPEIEMPR